MGIMTTGIWGREATLSGGVGDAGAWFRRHILLRSCSLGLYSPSFPGLFRASTARRIRCRMGNDFALRAPAWNEV
jgi:hypothetical protein